MGEMIEFSVNGSSAGGYLSIPESGSGPGVLVIQEWWGLNPQLKGVADRFAAEGFVALAPDLYHGELAEHDEMDKAGELMTNLPPSRAAADMAGAITALLNLDACARDAVGAVGFCMGGMLTLMIAALEGDRVAAAVPYYGAPLGDDGPDWSNLTATVRGHFAENDDFFGPEPVKALEAKLVTMGKNVSFTVYEGTGHAFANETNALGTYNETAASTAWSETISFLNAEIG